MPPDPLRILLVGNYVPERQQSMLRFGEVLRRGLSERGHHVTLLQPEPRWLGSRDPRRGLGKWLGYGDKLVRFPARLRAAAREHDVVHVLDHSNAPYCQVLAGLPHLITCHDLLAVRSALGEFPQQRTRWSGRRLQAMILRGLRRARLVACVSQSTRDDVVRLAHLGEDRLALVPNGLNHPYVPQADTVVDTVLTRAGLPRGRYLLHVGGNHWYKHRPGALRIAAALARQPGFTDLHLAMVGEEFDDHLHQVAAETALGDRLHVLTQVDNDTLAALYSGALALVFPSLHEGFGWPVIEAQACGCPAFIADRAPLPEVAGSGAVTFDPLDAEAAARVIAAALPRRAELVAAGCRNVARHTTAAMLDGYLALYRRVMMDAPARAEAR
jgi:glycosyltransferase involved in cell wall biosynthesis